MKGGLGTRCQLYRLSLHSTRQVPLVFCIFIIELLSRQSNPGTSITGTSASASFSSKKRPLSRNVSGMLTICAAFLHRFITISYTLSLLGPGAKNILPKLTDKKLPAEERMDIKKTPRSLDIREWGLVVRAFKEWPFRPEVYITLLLQPFFVKFVLMFPYPYHAGSFD